MDGDHARTHTPSSHSTRLLFILRSSFFPNTSHTHTQGPFPREAELGSESPDNEELLVASHSKYVCLSGLLSFISVCLSVVVVPSSVFPLHEIDETTN